MPLVTRFSTASDYVQETDTQTDHQTSSTIQTIYWILAASKGRIKQTYRKIMRSQNHITGNDLVQIE